MKWPWQKEKRDLGRSTLSFRSDGEALSGNEEVDGSSAEKGSELLSDSDVESDELGALAKLPPFRPVVIALVRLFDRPDVTPAEIAALVESDPTLASEILAVVNSPLFAFRQDVASPPHAISLLGVERTKSLAATLAMRSLMQGGPRTPVVRRFWIHSIASATIGRMLAPIFNIEPEMGHVTGLMHDLGRTGLLAAHPEEYARLALAAHGNTAEILAQEQESFGMTHCHAGCLLATAWRLPEAFIDVTEQHHSPDANQGRVGLVQMACRLADSFMYQSIHRSDVEKPDETIANFAPPDMHTRLLDRLADARMSVDNAIQTLDF